ncbi:hypothetical protein ACH5RR_041258 [Cinchona calisaya]|uniref:Protein FAR1-RELATED SEQUENCE n=1 Tax=Cinchona calisaya TaxID=153742 RepID=A0ABD2XUY9_9GENT
MLAKCSPNEFLFHWENLIDEFGIQNNDWVRIVYCKKRRWAEAYCRGYFFAGMRSTQRSEKMNAFLNQYLHDKMHLYKFSGHFALQLWYNKGGAVHQTMNTSPIMSTETVLLERHASKIFTCNVFYRGEIGCLKKKYKEAGTGEHIGPRISDFSKRYRNRVDVLDPVFTRAKGDHKSCNKGNMLNIIKGHVRIDKKKGPKSSATHENGGMHTLQAKQNGRMLEGIDSDFDINNKLEDIESQSGRISSFSSGGSIQVTEFWKEFRGKIVDSANETSVVQITWAFFLYMLGCTIFSDIGNTIYLWCLPALEDVDKIDLGIVILNLLSFKLQHEETDIFPYQVDCLDNIECPRQLDAYHVTKEKKATSRWANRSSMLSNTGHGKRKSTETDHKKDGETPPPINFPHWSVTCIQSHGSIAQKCFPVDIMDIIGLPLPSRISDMIRQIWYDFTNAIVVEYLLSIHDTAVKFTFQYL